MQNHVRRSVLSAAAAVAALGLVAGCGSGTDGTSTGGKNADEPAAKALSKPELARLALEQGDVEGFTIEKGLTDDVAPPPADAKIRPAECAPYADLVMNTAPGQPATVELRTVTEETPENVGDSDGDGELSLEELEEFEEAMDDALGSAVVKVGVATYEGDEAETGMEDLRSWTGACRGGFAVGDQKQGVEEVTGNAPAEGTDEAITFTVTVGSGKEQSPMAKWAVYRDGNNVVSFMVMNLAAMAGERTDEEWGVPRPVLDAQLAKLG